MRVIHVLLAAVMITASSPLLAHAQLGGGQLPLPPDGVFSLHVPHVMIADSRYEGMVLLERPRDSDYVINLASDSRNVMMPQSITIPAGQNHAIFGIDADAPYDGTALVHGVTSEHSAVAETRLYSISESPTSILLVAPGVGPAAGAAQGSDHGTLRTSAEVVPMKVVLANNYGLPIQAETDTKVTLTSSAGVEFSSSFTNFEQSHEITIPAGRFMADIKARVYGDGTAYAVSDSLLPATLPVDYIREEPRLNLQITPVPAASGSAARYFVWIELAGSLYVPTETVFVTLTSGSNDHLVFNPGDFKAPGSGSTAHVVISPWREVASGLVYTGDPTEEDALVSVTATSESIESATELVAIAGLEGGGMSTPLSRQAADHVDAICLWVNPTSPSRSGWITAGLFYTNSTTGLNFQCYQEHEEVDAEGGMIPVRLIDSGLEEHDIAGLIEHTQGISIERRPTAVQTNTYPATSADFEFRVLDYGAQSASAGLGGDGGAAMFTTAPPYGTDNRITLSAIPAIPGAYGDIAYVYVENISLTSVSDGSLADTDSVLVTEFGDSILDLSVDPLWTGSTSTVRGTYVGDSEVLITAVGTGVMSAEPLAYSGFGTSRAIDVWMPNMVNTDSEFPVAIHAMNDADVPVAKIPAGAVRISTADGEISIRDHDRQHTIIRGTIAMDGAGYMSVISADGHITEFGFSSFSNAADDVSVESLSPDVIQLGSEIFLDLLTGSMTDPDISILSDLDFVRDADTGKYAARPDRPGTYTATILVDKDGWERHTTDLKWEVEHMVEVTFQTVTDDGVGLDLDMTIVSAKGEETTVPSGVYGNTRAGVNTVSMPLQHSFGADRTYNLKEMRANGEEIQTLGSGTVQITEDTVFTAIYQREIEVSFVPFIDTDSDAAIDAEIDGNGVYRYGDTVRLTAPPVPEWFGLVWHVPDRWVTDDIDARGDGGNMRFEAVTSVSGHVEYSRNHTALMALIVSATTVPVILIWKKSPETFLDIRDFVVRARRSLAAKKRRPRAERQEKVKKKKASILSKMPFGRRSK